MTLLLSPLPFELHVHYHILANFTKLLRWTGTLYFVHKRAEVVLQSYGLAFAQTGAPHCRTIK